MNGLPDEAIERARDFIEAHSFEREGLTMMDVTPALPEAFTRAVIGDDGSALVKAGDLLSSKEAAALLRVDRTTVSRWRSAGYLPAPFDEVGAGPIWLRATLEEFAERHAGHADAAGRRPLGTAR